MVQEMNTIIEPVIKVNGELEFKGDKSISHRAVLFSAMAEGDSVIKNLSHSEDVFSSLKCLNQLGINHKFENDQLTVSGKGIFGFTKSNSPLDSGNSGTTARLLSGILAMQKFDSEIVGDESLSRRPMKRITEPLEMMGAKFESNENITLPLKILPSNSLRPINYKLPVASAQIKSAVLLAGLHLDEKTSVIELLPSRDHTERMLELNGIEVDGGIQVFSSKKDYPKAHKYIVPGDISSAAFFIILCLLKNDSELRIKNILLNEGRTGFIEILQAMGAVFKFENFKICSNEFTGDLIVKSFNLKNIVVPKEKIPSIIDEIPILAVAGIFAEGDFEIRNCKELRVKETDRISSLCKNFKEAGLKVTEFEDGFRLEGSVTNTSPKYNSFGDHRIAMAFAILGALTTGCEIENFECAKISNPEFILQLNSITE
ncbi:MAG: 3-phosphoshikimate 1-carboxyvinyltransferase [Melioribacteraceae bacterium]|nr:3-phosphoshikimate 1-carboxyvinyltransferase [Melioribacteraceae bacterium]